MFGMNLKKRKSARHLLIQGVAIQLSPLEVLGGSQQLSIPLYTTFRGRDTMGGGVIPGKGKINIHEDIFTFGVVSS